MSQAALNVQPVEDIANKTLEERLGFLSRRRRNIQEGLPLKNGIGLEVSPNWAPLITKNEANISYCDCVSYADLCEREKTNPGRIENGLEVMPLDFIWTPGKQLAECSNSPVKYDYIVSSHVLEHVPNFLGYLYQMREALQDDGIIAFVLPNSRGSGEYFRRLSEAADLVQSYLTDQSAPSVVQIYDSFKHIFEFTDIDLSNKTLADVKTYYTPKVCLEVSERSLKEYVDTHCWAFTTKSFVAVMGELKEIGLFDFDIIDVKELDITKTGHCNEFYIKLRPIPRVALDGQASSKQMPKNLPHSKFRSKLQIRNDLLQDEIEAMRRSTSWRITAPLRKLRSLLKV